MPHVDDMDRVTVIIPVLNEEKAIGYVLDEILSIGIPRENIIVVDGGSIDRTVEIAKSRGVRIIVQRGRGKADAVKTGLAFVSTPYTLVMDGDGTYPAEGILNLLNVALRNECDFVIGVRVFREGSQKLLFKFGNKVLSLFFNILFGVKLRDVLSGMYLAKTSELRSINFEMKGFSVEPEIVAYFANLGNICEELIEYRSRIDPSAKKLRIIHGFKIAIDIIKLTWRYNPTFLIFMLGGLLLIPGLILGAWVGYHYFFTGIKYYVKGLIAIILTVAGFNSLIATIITLYVSRVEQRFNKKLESLRKMLISKSN